VVDFRRGKRTPPVPVSIQGLDIEIVKSYKYLGVHLNNKLDWSDHAHALYKKGQSRLFLLRRLRAFGVQGALLKTFFDSVVASAIFDGVVFWSSSMAAADKKRLNKLLKKASSVLGCPLDTVGDGRMMAKLSSLMNHASHPMLDTLAALLSSFSHRLIPPRCLRERNHKSFLPAAVRLHNTLQ